MLLALDVGNSNITIGVFRNGELAHRWRLHTNHEQTEDEWGILLRNLFSLASLDSFQIDGVIIASVVPPLNPSLRAMSRHYFHREPVFVNHETDIGLVIAYENPAEVGADRLVNAVAAYHHYGGPCVVVDLGTAITFDVVSADAEYLGGIICAGIGVSQSALFAKTARLPMVDFRRPEKLVGTTTVGSIQSGFYFGVIAMIDGLVESLKEELGADTQTVATGGHAQLIVEGSRHIASANEDLTLEGLRLVWERAGAGR